MRYLVGENVFTFNSGIEFSQFERLKVFNDSNEDTVILLRNYNRMLNDELKKHGLKQKDVINMYDFFQGTVRTKRKRQSLRLLAEIPLKDYHIVGIDNNHSNLEYKGKKIADIRVMPGTVGLIGSIDYYDSLGQSAVKEYWDWRGFKSMVETYHPDGSIAMQQYLNLDGRPVLEVTHMYIGKKVLPTMWKLLDYKGRDWQFRTENQLFTFFLNEINIKNPGIFISDRRTLDSSVLNIEGADKKIAYLHNIPFIDNHHPQHGLMGIYQTAINGENGKEFDSVVVPTQDLATEIKKLTTSSSEILTAPDSYVEKTKKAKKLGDKIVIAYVGRLAEEKGILTLIRAFKHIHAKLPQTYLKLQGYFSDLDYRNKVEALIKKAKLSDVVEIIPYNPQKTVLDNATLFLNASLSEGFGMNMLESLGKGVPVITFDIKYVKKNLIKDNVNGYNVTKATPNGLADKVISVLQNSELYEVLSQGAIATAKNHNEETFMNSWKQILN
ncbi:glycosyltransferase [Limosilactobacillus reuteri]|uniref:Glycosyltransferase n=1 Tax=Limosilactobacillus reuteri TaxID=1598 RepID=A0A517D5G7_LIMRT|nr:glycosyltransferase [Limosilactobacillus reuteri]QDR72602.1 glycosyltransferase [Limosilactobacillus reuteri]